MLKSPPLVATLSDSMRMSPCSWGDIFTWPLRGDRIIGLRHYSDSSLTPSPSGCRVRRQVPSQPDSPDTRRQFMSFRRALWALAVAVCLAAPVAVQAQGDYLDVFMVKVKPEKTPNFLTLAR